MYLCILGQKTSSDMCC